MELETAHLLLRSISLEDKYEIFEYRGDAETSKYQGFIPLSVDDIEEFISHTSSKINEPGSWFQFVIIEKGLHKVIGDLGIHFSETDNNKVAIGITLNKIFHKRGYASEAMKAVIGYLFNQLDKDYITASIDPANESSIKLFERLGFRKKAHLTRSLYINGEWVDDVIYAISRNDLSSPHQI